MYNMGFEMLMTMIEMKSKSNGIDLTVMENILGIHHNKNFESCSLIDQSDINASKRIKRLT